MTQHDPSLKHRRNTRTEKTVQWKRRGSRRLWSTRREEASGRPDATYLSDIVVLSQILVRAPQPRVQLMSELLCPPRQFGRIEELSQKPNGRFGPNIHRLEERHDVRRQVLDIDEGPDS